MGLTFLKPEGFKRYSTGFAEDIVVTLISRGRSELREDPQQIEDEIRIDIQRYDGRPLSHTDEHNPVRLAGEPEPIEVEWRGRTLDGVRAEQVRIDDSLVAYSVDLELGDRLFRVTLRGHSFAR